MAIMEPQALLSLRLSTLLGFEDGTDDVLELLLSMDDSQVHVVDAEKQPSHLVFVMHV
jgi:hypothetical protein